MAGPHSTEYPPGTKLWRSPAFVTQFWLSRSWFGARFLFFNSLDDGEKYKTKVVGNSSSYCLLLTFPPLGLTKTETAVKTAPRVPKLGYDGGRAPQFSAWGTLATSETGMVCSMGLFP